MPHDHEDHDFNSIKVQLKLPEASPLILAPIFQFHKGTIKTSILLFLSRQSIIFQFHKGTIKTLVLPLVQVLLSYFNSIKVQLKLGRIVQSCAIYLFQFHKGTIKTRNIRVHILFHSISIP